MPSLSDFNLHPDRFQFQISSPDFSLQLLLCMRELANIFTWLAHLHLERSVVTTELIVLPTKPAPLVVFLSTIHSVSHKTQILSQQVLSMISRPFLASPLQAFTESVSFA